MFVGVLRWQSRVWSLVSELISQRSNLDTSTTTATTEGQQSALDAHQLQQIEDELLSVRNIAVKEVCHQPLF